MIRENVGDKQIEDNERREEKKERKKGKAARVRGKSEGMVVGGDGTRGR